MTQREQSHEPHVINVRGQALPSVALALFDGTAPAHELGDQARGLLQIAAAYYAAARTAGAAQPGRAARDAVLNAPLDGLKPDQQCVVASALAFQREKLRRSRETAFLRLDEDDQEMALRLGALLGLAEALAGSDADVLILADATQTTVQISGDAAALLSARAEERADRWRKAIGALTLGAASAATQWLLADAPRADAPPAPLAFAVPHSDIDGLRGDEPIAEGARRMLRRQFERMLAREDDVRAGEDPEDVHQMRVASRRLRASLQIVAPVYDPKRIGALRRRLRGIAQALGAVRDRDVFLIDLAAHADTLAEEQRGALEPLRARVAHERADARRTLLAELDSRRYAKFKHSFATFLTTPGAGVAELPETGLPERVRDRAGAMLWRRYEEWRAFEAALPGASDATMHQARIAGKRLRYTLEFFADALGPKVDEVLDPLTALQENLGSLQDAVVAREHVHALGLSGDPGAQEYIASRSAAREQHLAEFPRLWERVSSATYRRRLFEMIVKM